MKLEIESLSYIRWNCKYHIVFALQALTCKRLVVSERRSERTCKRAAGGEVTFCERGRSKEEDGCFSEQRKTEQSELYSDLAPQVGLEPTTFSV